MGPCPDRPGSPTGLARVIRRLLEEQVPREEDPPQRSAPRWQLRRCSPAELESTADLLGPVYISGKARSGKTWLLQAIAIHLARSGAGFCFVDPHADAAAELTSYLSDRADDLLPRVIVR